MKAITEKIKTAARSVPADVKKTVSSFAFSAVLMTSLLWLLGMVFEPKGANEALTFEKPCGLEPYIENIIFAQATPSLTECSVSEESELEMLARSAEMTFGKESYAARVAFCAVILNRVEDDRFPSTVAGVMKSAGVYPSSFEGSIPERSVHAARSAMLGVDPTLGALYIINLSDPAYAEYEQRVTAIYGDHAFIN